MTRKISICAMALWALIAFSARADEASVRKIVQGKFPTMTVESVKKAPFAGLYEVVLDGEIVYTDEKVHYFFAGNIYDIRTSPPRNLTQRSSNQMIVSTLNRSLGQAFKRVRGNGKRVLYTFEDPNCAYCKRLHRELAKVTDVTIYTFLLPILSPNSVEKAKEVWCAKDRVKAWDEVMTTSTVTNSVTTCDTPLAKNRLLMQRFGIRGTPAVYLANGQHIGGFIPAEKIEQALNSVSSK